MSHRTIVAAAAIWLAAGLSASAGQKTAWDYAGPTGPEAWGILDPAFRTCSSGDQQSPIDLSHAVETELMEFEFYWRADDWQVHNTGHGIEVSGKNPGFALLGDERWELLGLHFHAPSEHTIGGIRYPMEMHFVHRNDEGDIAVIGVFLKGGGRNDSFESIIANAPLHAGDTPGRLGKMSLAQLLTDPGDVMRYQGSLTTPPCSQNVMWTVLTDPLVVSDAAILAFTSIYPENARPLQETNRRFVLTD